MNISNSTFSVNDTENFYNLEDISVSPSSAKANIPKLMPNIAIAKPKRTKDNINRTMFCNAPECKPTPGKIVKLQNYITIPKHPDRKLTLKSKATGGMIEKRTKLTLEIMHGDIRKMYITDKE